MKVGWHPQYKPATVWFCRSNSSLLAKRKIVIDSTLEVGANLIYR